MPQKRVGAIFPRAPDQMHRDRFRAGLQYFVPAGAAKSPRELGVAEDLEKHIAPSRHVIQALHLNGRRSNHEIH